jgi:hypothetical protein
MGKLTNEELVKFILRISESAEDLANINDAKAELLRRLNDKRAVDIIKEIQKFNNLKNNTDIYLYEFCQWGLGIIETKPNPSDYGL